MKNVNDSYFDGYYKEIWRTVIPDELTVREIDFIVPFFDLKPGSKVLDLMCGYGRHTLSLARKGIHVNAIDNLPDYIQEIEKISKEEDLPVKLQQTDVLSFKTDEKFDLAICMGNSLNFFNSKDIVNLFETISACLKPGGQLLINSWSLAETVFKNFREKAWSNIGDLKFLTDSSFLFHPSRIETTTTIIDPDNRSEIKIAIDYIYSVNEMEDMLMKSGFILKEIYSIPGKKKFTLGEPRAYIIAQKS
ncbi:MAG: class I SAM-dependent methyltransferase [Bacteroidota bacterium]